MTKTIDDLIRESDEALKRIETLEAKKRSISTGKGLMERVLQHSKQHSHHLVPIALAAGLVGLSLVRYHEKHSHKECIQGLEDRIRTLEADVEAQREKGIGLSRAVHACLDDSRHSWWKSSSVIARKELQKALDVYHGAHHQDEAPEPAPDERTEPSVKKNVPRPFI